MPERVAGGRLVRELLLINPVSLLESLHLQLQVVAGRLPDCSMVRSVQLVLLPAARAPIHQRKVGERRQTQRQAGCCESLDAYVTWNVPPRLTASGLSTCGYFRWVRPKYAFSRLLSSRAARIFEGCLPAEQGGFLRATSIIIVCD